MMKICTTWIIGVILVMAACDNGSSDDTTVYITMAANASFVTGGSGGVTISGNRITITKGGVYSVSGSLPGGTLLVDTSDDVELILNGAEITADERNAIDITGTGNIIMTLASGTTTAIDGSIFSHPPLTISGGGTLKVTSGYSGTENPAETYTGIHSDGLLTIESGNLQITNCYEGLEGAQVVIKGGTIDIDSYDDGINADKDASAGQGVEEGCFIEIVGGNITIHAGDDAIDSNGYLLFLGGNILLHGESGDGIDSGTKITINGGILCAT
jgi:hypothetical protein